MIDMEKREALIWSYLDGTASHEDRTIVDGLLHDDQSFKWISGPINYRSNTRYGDVWTAAYRNNQRYRKHRI